MWLCRLKSRVFYSNGCIRCYANRPSIGEKTYYEILNVKPVASQDEIRESFLKLSKLHHPDTAVGNGKETHNEFILLSEAYTVLSKPALRKIYDHKLQEMNNNPDRYGVYRRAKSRMDDDLGAEYWQKHWHFSQNRKEDVPRDATQENFNQKKKVDVGYILVIVLFLIGFSMNIILLVSKDSEKDIKSINDDYNAWLVDQFSKENTDQKVKPPEVFR